jgi:hypothetical protein
MAQKWRFFTDCIVLEIGNCTTCEKTVVFFLNCSYVCPEPDLANIRFLLCNGAKKDAFADRQERAAVVAERVPASSRRRRSTA